VANRVGLENEHESEASCGRTRRIWAKSLSIRPISQKIIPFITNIYRTLLKFGALNFWGPCAVAQPARA
jgi:hypothetical protein